MYTLYGFRTKKREEAAIVARSRGQFKGILERTIAINVNVVSRDRFCTNLIAEISSVALGKLFLEFPKTSTHINAAMYDILY